MDQAQALLKKRFAAADSNHDGKLTLEEAKAGGMPRVVKNFDEIDADHKGYVTLDDIKLFAAQKLAEHKAEGNDP
ncbi:MAG: EF-hand domain-containing protein [Burkholderiaceae bacterium]